MISLVTSLFLSLLIKNNNFGIELFRVELFALSSFACYPKLHNSIGKVFGMGLVVTKPGALELEKHPDQFELDESSTETQTEKLHSGKPSSFCALCAMSVMTALSSSLLNIDASSVAFNSGTSFITVPVVSFKAPYILKRYPDGSEGNNFTKLC